MEDQTVYVLARVNDGVTEYWYDYFEEDTMRRYQGYSFDITQENYIHEPWHEVRAIAKEYKATKILVFQIKHSYTIDL